MATRLLVVPDRYQQGYRNSIVNGDDDEAYSPARSASGAMAWPVMSQSGMSTGNPFELPVGTGRVGGGHYIEMGAAAELDSYETVHTFDATTWVYWSFPHRLQAISTPTDGDDVYVMHLARSDTVTDGTWIAVTMQIKATGSPAV